MRNVLLALVVVALIIEVGFIFYLNGLPGASEAARAMPPQPEAIGGQRGPVQSLGIEDFRRIGDETRAALYRPDLPNRRLGPHAAGFRLRAEGGAAPGAELRIDQRPAGEPPDPNGYPRLPFWTARADDAGVVRIEGLPEGSFIARAAGPGGFAIAPFDLRAGAAEPNLTLNLRPAGGIRGTVRTAAGAPAEGARIQVLDPRRDLREDVNLLAYFPILTDASGAFAIDHLPAPAKLAIHAEGHPLALTDYIAPPAEELRVTLQEGRPLEGIARNAANHPIPGLTLLLDPGTPFLPDTAVTDSNGQFRFPHPRPAQHELRIQSAHYALPDGPLPVDTAAQAGRPLEVIVERTGFLRGRVLDGTSGEGMPGVAVFAEAPAHGQVQATTDQGGYYYFQGIAPGSYRVRLDPASGHALLNPQAAADPTPVHPGETAAGPTLRVRAPAA